ncbi:MAG: hypothetical protein H6988_01570 [Pseudomonadales bacterium]|nr:hypothetical protein [Halieaceae bacterium]MCP5189060.1 hypothetical protein [Pseudomonadales bacterium]
MSNTRSKMLFAALALVATQALAEGERQWPDKVFDCQVVTVDGAQGLVSLQSLSAADAGKGAVGLPAVTLLGNKGYAARVIQCVEKGSGKGFRDSSFQAWVEKLDQ